MDYKGFDVCKFEMYKFYFSDHVYFQCEVDMSGSGTRVNTEFWIGKDAMETKFSVLEVPYERIHMLTEAVPTLLGGIKLLLTEEYVWECIENLFHDKKEYKKFAKKHQPELTNELTE